MISLWRYERAMWRMARFLVPRDPWIERSAYPKRGRR